MEWETKTLHGETLAPIHLTTFQSNGLGGPSGLSAKVAAVLQNIKHRIYNIIELRKKYIPHFLTIFLVFISLHLQYLSQILDNGKNLHIGRKTFAHPL